MGLLGSVPTILFFLVLAPSPVWHKTMFVTVGTPYFGYLWKNISERHLQTEFTAENADRGGSRVTS